MKANKVNCRILSVFMVLCLLLGMMPMTAMAAEEEPTPGDSTWLQEEIDNAANNGVIEIDHDLVLGCSVYFPAGKTLTLRGKGDTMPTIMASNTFKEDTLFRIEGGEITHVSINKLIIDGSHKVRGIYAGANVWLVLGGSRLEGEAPQLTIQNCNTSGASQHGAGLAVYNGSHVLAVNVLFDGNTANPATGTGGAGVYLRSATGQFAGCTFSDNKANSGGGIYFFGGTEESVLLLRDCTFNGNKADQRGGAVVCHGYGVTDNCHFATNESGQYGGAVYISGVADKEGVNGKLLLRNTNITRNKSGSNGAGVFIANNGTIYLDGNESTVSDNWITEEDLATDPDKAPSDGFKNNIFFNGVNSKIVVLSSTGKMGVSTSNPSDRKLAVFSIKTAGDETRAEASKFKDKLDGTDFPWGKELDYTMEDYPDQYKQFEYDGEAWTLAILRDNNIKDQSVKDLFDLGTSAQISAGGPFCTKGNMWLVLRNTRGGSSTINTPHKPYVVFDFNLPGSNAKIVNNLVAGTKITTENGWPTSPTKGEVKPYGQVNFTFKGWFTQPIEGDEVQPGVTITKDTVFYAHWDMDVIHGSGGVPTFKGIYLVYFDQNYPGGGFTASYKVAGQFHFTAEYKFTNPETGKKETGYEDVDVDIPWGWPGRPSRKGYDFLGWSLSSSGGSLVNESTWKPTDRDGAVTMYGQWRAKSCNLIWHANGGEWENGSAEELTIKPYDSVIDEPPVQPTKTGYEFTGWYLDSGFTIPLASGTLVQREGDTHFYAGWTPKEYTITWDANYTGGTLTTVKQHHDEKLNILPKPTREGYSFGGWYTKPGGAGTRAESYGTVREDVTFYAKWTNNTQDYTVRLEWDDQSNNDNVRPESITVSLVANGIPTGLSYVLDSSDADRSGNIWSYTFEGLDVTDAVSNPITYSVAITSTVSDQYSYGIENKSAEQGYILMTHSLITTDINSYVVWEDDGNNDGYRPSTVNLQLYANGKKVEDAEGRLSISGSGNTWTYTFADFQKFYTDEAGNKGREIRYTLEATPTNPGELDEYSIAYHNYTVILSHRKDTVSRSVHVEWQDSNNQDGKRPASMMVQLYADNVPLEGKVVLLSNANNWTHTWDDLAKYADGGREVTYSARVSSTLVDYTAKSTGMTIEMTYVPSSTSISAFVTWTDENDADGLRPDYVTAQLVANGKPTGNSQVLSATSGWTVSWTGYPIYKDGDRIEYTFQVAVPDGYEADYHGVYDTSGLSAVLTHQRLKQELTGNIVWEDRDNQSGGRMGSVAVLLYADGSVIDEDDKVWISAEDGWEHTFSNLPVYRDGGQEIKYSMVLVSDPGKYIPTTSKMTITMRLEPEYVDVPFQIIWDDNNDSDGARPGYVAVALLVDGKPSPYGETATAQTDWAVTFSHLDRYGTNGLYLYKAQLAEVPDGYTATYTSPGVVVLKRVAQTKDVTATVTWLDNNNQYRERPEQVTLTLYADRLDGSGPQNTGRVEKCKAADGWTFTFEDVPAYYSGKNILYSVVASGNLPNYTISYDGMEVFMRHVSYQPPVTVDYTAKVVWHDGHNAKGSRPYNLLVTLYADGESCGSYTMTEADLDATDYTWLHTFADLPTKVDGKNVAYTIGVTEPAHYITQTQGNTITMTHVMDIPILVRWHDQRDNDGVRPEVLTLELFGDSVKTDTSIPLTGDHTAETWRNSFRQIPVWSDAQMDREIVYSWAFAGDDLTNSGYRVDYNGFTSSTVGNEDMYPIDISRPGEVSDVTVSLKWDDGSDRDGLRPNALDVELLADGKTTGESLTLTDSNKGEEWTGTFKDLPVWKDGQRIQYSIRVAAPTNYTAKPVEGNPLSVTLFHKPAEKEIVATVAWDDESSYGGLQRFDIAAELLVDGEPRFGVGVLEAEKDYQESWGRQFVYRDHGTPIDYSVRVTEPTKIPDDYDVSVEGFTIKVTRARYHIDGKVLQHIGSSVAVGATVTLYESDQETVVERMTVSTNGEFHFTVPRGDYYIKAEWVKEDYYYSYASPLPISNRDLRPTLTLLQTYSISGVVSDNHGNPLPDAQVVVRLGDRIVDTVTTNELGQYNVDRLPGSVYVLQARYSHGGSIYLSEGRPGKPMGFNAIVDLIITLPSENIPYSAATGRVVDKNGQGVSSILVHCRNDAVYPNTLVMETVTDSTGSFTLRRLPEGNYTLTFLNAEGNELRVDHPATFTTPNAETTIPLGNIVLSGGTVLPSTPTGAGMLSGVALDKDGQPAQGAQVIVTDKSTGKVQDILTTDSSGIFDVTLPAGEYAVSIQKPFQNNTNHPTRVDDEAASKEDGPVTADSFTIRGEVLDEDGQPVEGVTVYLYGEDGQIIQISTASEAVNAVLTGVKAGMDAALLADVEEALDGIVPTEVTEADADQAMDEPAEDSIDVLADDGYIRLDERVTAEDGKYVFAGLPAGRYVVKIAHGGIGGNGGSTDIPVTVQPLPEIPDDADLTVTIDSYTVSGVVADKNGDPVNGAKVKLLDAENNEVSSLTTGEDGAYTFDTLPKGDYTVNISYPDSDLLASGDVTITDGGFTAFPGQTVNGKIKDNKGNALSNVTVTLRGEDGRIYTAVTDKDGIYRVALVDGKYTMAATYQGKAAEKTITVNGKAINADLTITLSDGGSTTPGGNTPGGAGGGSGSGGSGGNIGGGGFIPDPDPTENQTFVLSGTVTDKDGKPVEGAAVTAVDAKTGKTYIDTTGADGQYALAVPKGSYTITISYGSVSSNPKKVSVSKDSSLDAIPMDSLGKLVLAYVNGYADGTFGGERHITRSEVAALISRVSKGFDKDKGYSTDFKDVPDGVWYASNLGYCVEAGLIQGRGNGMFDPNANITRAEFAAIVARFLGLPNEATGESRYTDISGNWAEGYIAQLTAKGIVEGKGDGKFDPNANISRYEAVTMLNRALERTPDKAALDALAANRTIRPFPDLHPTHWAYHQVLEAAFDHYHK